MRDCPMTADELREFAIETEMLLAEYDDADSPAIKKLNALADWLEELELPWVSVEERLPEEDGVYDTCHDGYRSYRYLRYEVKGGWFAPCSHWRETTPIPPLPESGAG